MPIKTRKQQGADVFRSQFLQKLKRNDHSVYWLANEMADKYPDICTRDNVFRYMRGDSDTSGAVIVAIASVLSMKVIKISA